MTIANLEETNAKALSEYLIAMLAIILQTIGIETKITSKLLFGIVAVSNELH